MADDFKLKRGAVRASVSIGDRLFPSCVDYEAYFVEHGYVDEPEEVWQSPNLAEEAQRHWYMQGQVGCVFARRAARRYDAFGWETKVITLEPAELSPPGVNRLLSSELAAATLSPTCQIVSLLFPRIRDLTALMHFIQTLLATDQVFLAKAQAFGEVTAISLQVPIQGSPVMAWADVPHFW